MKPDTAETKATRNRYRTAVIATSGGQFAFAGIAFAGSIVTARLLGPSGRGALTVLILVPTLLIVALELGQEFTSAHLVARVGKARRHIAENVCAYAVAVCIPSGPIVAIVVWGLGVGQGKLLTIGIAGGIAVGAGVLLRGLSGLAVGLGRVRLYNASRIALAAVLPVGAVLLAALGVRSATAFFFIWCAGGLTAAAVLVIGLRMPTTLRISPTIAREQWTVGIRVHAANVAQFLLLRVDQLLLTVMIGTAAVGVYAVAVNVAEAVWYLPAAAALVALPLFSGDATPTEKRAVLRTALRAGFVVPTIAAAVVALISPFLVPVIFGTAFHGSVLPLELLLPGVVAASTVRICTAVLIAAEKAPLIFRAGLGALVANVLLNLLLIPMYGAAGASIASSVTYCAFAVVLMRAASSASGSSFMGWMELAFVRERPSVQGASS